MNSKLLSVFIFILTIFQCFANAQFDELEEEDEVLSESALATQVYDKVLDQIQVTTFAENTYDSFRVKKSGIRVYYRKPYLYLKEAIDLCNEEAKLSSTVIHLYADLMIIDGDTTITANNRSTIYLYARELKAFGSAKLTIKYTGRLNIYFAGPLLPEDFLVQFVNSENGQALTQRIELEDKKYGISVEVTSKDGLTTYSIDEPVQQLKYFEYTADLDVSDGDFVEDDLARLLQFQVLLAAAWIHQYPNITESLLRFVRRSTKLSPEALSLNLQVDSLLDRIAYSSTFELYIPTVDLQVVKENLMGRLEAAEKFESEFKRYTEATESATSLSDQGLSLAQALLLNSELMSNQYDELEGHTRERAKAASKAVQKGYRDMDKLIIEADEKRNDFEKGIKKYEKEKAKERKLQTILSSITLVLSLGAAVTGCMPNVQSLTSGVKIVDMISKLAQDRAMFELGASFITIGKTVLDSGNQMAHLHSEKFRPDLINTVNVMYNKVEKHERYLSVADIIQPINKLVWKYDHNEKDLEGDYYQKIKMSKAPSKEHDLEYLKSEYDMMRAELELKWPTLAEKGIDGAEEYFKHMLKIPELGKAILTIQKAAIQVMDEQNRYNLQRKTSNYQSNILNRHFNNLKKLSPLACKTFKKVMFDRLVMTRNWVAVAYNEYLDAYKYYALDPSPRGAVPFMSPSSFYLERVADLQNDIQIAISRYRSQETTIFFKASDHHSIFPLDWKERFLGIGSRNHTLKFKIDPRHPEFSDYRRIRITAVQFYLDGSKARTIKFHIKTGLQIVDKVSDIETPGFNLTSINTLAFVMKPINLEFKYHIDSNGETNVVTDGKLYKAESFARPTPFMEWSIRLVNTSAVEEIMEGVTDLTMKLSVEFTTDFDIMRKKS